MDTDPLLGQDFYRGFVKPATKAEIQYHLQYGWSRTLVYTLMIQEIDIAPDKLHAIDAAVRRRAKRCSSGRRTASAFCAAANASALFARECPHRRPPRQRYGTLHFVNRLTTRCEFLRFQNLIMKLRALHFEFVRRMGEHQQLKKLSESGQLNAKGRPSGSVSFKKHLTYTAYYCPVIAGFRRDFLGGPACGQSRSIESISRPSRKFSLIPRSAESMLLDPGAGRAGRTAPRRNAALGSGGRCRRSEPVRPAAPLPGRAPRDEGRKCSLADRCRAALCHSGARQRYDHAGACAGIGDVWPASERQPSSDHTDREPDAPLACIAPSGTLAWRRARAAFMLQGVPGVSPA